ncbi:MAG: type VI secretion system baseplate subunit TssG, partial [Burkholderiales bacterium]
MRDASDPVMPATVADVFRASADEPHRWDFYQAMRLIDARHPDKPRLGDALRPIDEPIRFTEEASLTFAPAGIAQFDRSASPPRLMQRIFGFLGPNGALPIHLTEYARERQLHHGDRTFGAFLNMLLHRFGLFFYRAWARANPVVSLDRPDDAPVLRHVGALIGLAEESMRERDALGDFAKLHFVGRLARSVRDADGLEAWVRLHFGLPVRVEQFCGHWMPLAREERSRLRRDGEHGLGRGAVLGSTLANVLASAGYNVDREYYLNNMGNQIRTFAKSVYARYLQVLGEAAEVPADGYMGDYVTELARSIVESSGTRFRDMGEEAGATAVGELGMSIVTEGIRRDLALLNVEFDEWFSEKSLHESG